jgi:hypothetical protein
MLAPLPTAAMQHSDDEPEHPEQAFGFYKDSNIE